jgi:DNA-binding MarR family transcriptional regulator
MRTGSAESESIGGGPALFRVVRYWSRRWAAEAADDRGRGDDVGAILLLDAVEAAAGSDGRAAIADVAAELGLDRSNASRMLSAAVESGYVTKSIDVVDGRRAHLTITASGRRLMRSARAWQREQFAELVADWPERDATRFAVLLERLAGELPEHRRSTSP